MVKCVHCVVWRIILPPMMRVCGYLQPHPLALQYCKLILMLQNLTVSLYSDITDECLLQNFSLSCSNLADSLLPKCLRAIREDVRNINCVSIVITAF